MPVRLLLGLFFLTTCHLPEKESSPPAIPMDDLPVALTNAALTAYEDDSLAGIYVFGGLGEGKTYEDITLRSFYGNPASGKWKEIAPVPDTLGKIAAAASTIGDILYVAGGYHVFADGSERSSNKLHRYAPAEQRWLADGPDIPVAIDDHVQVVYKDSLLLLLSGWHDTANVNLVQIYDPVADTWTEGSSLPDHPASYVFGASGAILNDTIYIAGGAGNRINKNFPIQHYLTKGYIHPDDPSQIDWVTREDSLAGIYRSACFTRNGKVYWLGGAPTSYNYNGISYKGEQVAPVSYVISYDPATGRLSVEESFSFSRMDLRGGAFFKSGQVYIPGGMESNQKVTKDVLRVEF